MATTKYADRSIPRISLHDFPTRLEEISAQLLHASETDGFFALTNHGITPDMMAEIFSASSQFFSLPEETKKTVPFTHANAGYEARAQVRPSTGKADQKESYQIQFGPRMKDLWLTEETAPGFKATCLDFASKCQAVSEKLMLCFARGLGFDDDYFIKAHDIKRPESQTVLRLLHYFAVDEDAPPTEGEYYRAGAHTDWDFITLLFQAPGQSGLEICPGRESVTTFGHGDTWTKVEPSADDIICNIGDLLMSWSDDRFKSTLHRVKTPSVKGVDYFGERFSIAFFNQPCTDCVIQGPDKKYPAITGEEFTKNAMMRNFKALEAKKKQLESVKGVAEGGVAVQGGN